jgi:hypothetical protein
VTKINQRVQHRLQLRTGEFEIEIFGKRFNLNFS